MSTGVDCHALLQKIFPTQGSNAYLLFPALVGRFFTTSTTWAQKKNSIFYLNFNNYYIEQLRLRLYSIGNHEPIEAYNHVNNTISFLLEGENFKDSACLSFDRNLVTRFLVTSPFTRPGY